jgi:DNA-directed RNA polymerase specialized sigma24 family protein
MSSLSPATLASAHQDFESVLPAIHHHFRYALRCRRQDREDLLAEAVACAWKAWRGLVERGRDPIAVGVSGIASWAIRHALKGRRIGNRGGGRHAMDIYHRRAQEVGGYRVVSYDGGADPGSCTVPSGWKEWLCADHRTSPADAAAFRVDFTAWLGDLPARRRRTAELLSEGRGTQEVAAAVGVTPAAISQTRSWLAKNWREFQGECR